ncbi:hypothetical protein ACQ4M4_25745 [Leptolyngbya sp. AN02str]
MNERLRWAKLEATVQHKRNRLYLQATLHPKPNSIHTANEAGYSKPEANG